MLTDSQRARLERHRGPLRFVIAAWWLLRGLLLFLTPTRRLLLLIGIVLTLVHINIQGERWNADGGFVPAGLLIILFVLMLELKDKLLARHELEDGHAVQRALMPERSPLVPGWRLWLFTRPANDVGGDLVDFVGLEGGTSALTIGDVSGKGLKAALLTARLQATLRAFILDSPTLVDLVSRVNAVFRRDSLRQIFASVICAGIGPGSGVVRIVNAGHPPPILIRPGGIEQMEKAGPALGLMDSAKFSEQVVDLAPGEIVLLYSDGLIETRNPAGEFFGEERLRNLLPGSCASPAAVLGERLVAACDNFQGDAPSHDDLSLVILQRS
ncbi:MAG TPA: PP2C family protein-serine/threonine phosphatase [Bacteroidota bacterium]|nr:PP2C family protein-serine/threonine phosphatase [Bacteroidota bacterium]